MELCVVCNKPKQYQLHIGFVEHAKRTLQFVICWKQIQPKHLVEFLK